MENLSELQDVVIIGAGFTGLSAGYELTKNKFKCILLESENEIGGLAASFNVGNEKLDRFYHHWFTNDKDVMSLINELGLINKVEVNPTNTGIYFANNFFKLSTPWDLLNFKPLNFFDRIKLGILAIRAKQVKNWKELENKTAEEWLKDLGGKNVYRIVWQPLLKGKFGPYANKISAVWFWNKLKLRGGSRGKGGEERLAYFDGGFISLAESISKSIKKNKGKILLNQKVQSVYKNKDLWTIETNKNLFKAKNVIFTTALPITAKLINKWANQEYLKTLNRIQYIGNICLILELKHSLSDTYWLNVNDPDFPFVGLIEHTNFKDSKFYNNKHIVYLSKYLPHQDKIYSMSKNEFLDYAIPYIKKMFPNFKKTWIINHHLWRAKWSQPIVEKNYSSLIPSMNGPKKGMFLCSMAQIYPEDRGTNYAIREGRKIGRSISEILTLSKNNN